MLNSKFVRGVSIIIPNWNGRELLPQFFPSAVAAAKHYRDTYGTGAEVVIIDDGSTDGSPQWLAEHYGQSDIVRIIACPENRGFSPAVNTGFAAARYPVALLLNNDLRVSLDAIAPLARHFDDPGVFAVCCKAYRLDGETLDGGGKLGWVEKGFWRVYLNYDIRPEALPERPPPFYSFFASGGYTAYDAAKLKELGGFCELLAPIYWEDVEICLRAWKRGWTVHYEPASVVYHQSSATMGKKSLRRRINIVAERNRLLMTWINLHDRRWLASHCLWLGLKLLGAVVSLDRNFLQAFRQALARLPEVRRERQREKRASIRTDRELEAIFDELRKNEWAAIQGDGNFPLRVRRKGKREG
ncbi:MAG TPA: glycosyltransferase family 2 protein [Blastocatellia bacterium]|nr:glycosyltransferase family 2 protein [Blastocatellia bacterium]